MVGFALLKINIQNFLKNVMISVNDVILMSKSKRFECVFVEDDEFGGTFRRLKDNEMNITYMVCDVADLLNFQNTQIKILKDENEQLKNKLNKGL